MKKVLFLLLCGIVLFNSCSSGGDNIEAIPTEQPDNSQSLGIYVKENQWIYSQMNMHYLWREDLPDSSLCNYLLDPVSFFKSLLSARDRFSYCEHNPYYRAETRSEDFYKRGSVLCDSIYEYKDCRIGYLCYGGYEDTKELVPVMKRFYDANIDELILDLRYNGGGLVSTCQYLCSCLVPENAYGKLLEYLKYNDIISKRRMKAGLDSVYSYTIKTPTNGKPTLGDQSYGLCLSRLFVLTSKRTASASESTILCLKPYMDVVTIGECTTGKGVGMETFYNESCKYQLVPITFQYYNATGKTVPDSGIMPDYPVEGGLDVDTDDIGNINEPLLETAINLILYENVGAIN